MNQKFLSKDLIPASYRMLNDHQRDVEFTCQLDSNNQWRANVHFFIMRGESYKYTYIVSLEKRAVNMMTCKLATTFLPRRIDRACSEEFNNPCKLQVTKPEVCCSNLQNKMVPAFPAPVISVRPAITADWDWPGQVTLQKRRVPLLLLDFAFDNTDKTLGKDRLYHGATCVGI